MGIQGARLGGRGLHAGRAAHHARMAALQGQHDRGRHLRDPAQHHRQARAWPAGLRPRLMATDASISDEPRWCATPRSISSAKRRPVGRAAQTARRATIPTGFSRALWREMAELGWAGFLVPEALRRLRVRLPRPRPGDGGGGPHAGRDAVAVDRAHRRQRAGPRRQPRRRKPSICPPWSPASGSSRWRSRRAPITPPTASPRRARRDGGGFRLDGEKRFVLDGHVADIADRRGADRGRATSARHHALSRSRPTRRA